MKKKIIKILIVLLLAIGLERFCHQQTDSFALYKIQSSLNEDAAWAALPLEKEEDQKIRQMLNQKFSYLGKGAQSFVFLSEDQNYVLKFFRYDHLQAPFWASRETKKNKEERRKRHFASCKIAYEELKEETGLIFLHLNKTKDLQLDVLLFDKLGIVHNISLDDYEFVLQKKADLAYDRIDRYLKEQNPKAKEAIRDLLTLLLLRSQKGIFDKDPDLRTNFGFVGDKPVQIDIGRFRKDEGRKGALMRQEELIRITAPLKSWLQEKDSALALFLEEETGRISAP